MWEGGQSKVDKFDFLAGVCQFEYMQRVLRVCSEVGACAARLKSVQRGLAIIKNKNS